MENALPAIPAKRYFTIGEVSELCGVKPYVLRYWEQEFTQLKPMKRRGNRRYYQHHEVLLIRRIRDRGITVLLVEHDMTLVMDLSDDILVLHDGTVIAEGSPATIQNDPNVISTYLGGEIRPAEEVELALLTGGQPDAVTGARVVPTRSSPAGEGAVR